MVIHILSNNAHKNYHNKYTKNSYIFLVLLLYYRKTCQACKCSRDTHAIYHEQVTSVRERLGFKPEMHLSKIDPKQVGYTWVPPGIMTASKVHFISF